MLLAGQCVRFVAVAAVACSSAACTLGWLSAEECSPGAGGSACVCPDQAAPRVESCDAVGDFDCNGVPNDRCASWSHAIHGGGEQQARGIAVSSTGVVVVGWMNTEADFGGRNVKLNGGTMDAFVAAYAPSDGAFQWAKVYGDAKQQWAYAVAIDDADGAIYVAGTFAGQIDFGAGPLTATGTQDVFVAKLSSNGQMSPWSVRFGGSGTKDNVAAIAVRNGQVAVTGSFEGSTDFGVGSPLTATGSMPDGYVVDLAAGDGHTNYARRFGGSGDDAGRSIAVGLDGSVVVTGYTSDDIDFAGVTKTGHGEDVLLARIDPSGGVTDGSVQLFGDAAPQSGQGVALTDDGSIVLAGDFQGTLDFGGAQLKNSTKHDAVFVTRLDPGGNVVWAQAFVGTALANVRGLDIGDGANDVLIGGTFTGSIDFGGGALENTPESALFFAKLGSTNGGYIYSRRFPAAQGLVHGLGHNGQGAILVGEFGQGSILFAPTQKYDNGYDYPDGFVAALPP